MYAACSKISYLPVLPSKVLSSLQNWVFGQSDQKNHEKIETLSSSPVTKVVKSASLTSSNASSCGDDDCQNDPGAGISVSVIHNPAELSCNAKNQIYKLTLPYTSRAFKQDFATMDPKSMQEHLDHTTPGDFLFLAVVTSATKTDGNHQTSTDSDLVIAPKVVFHLLCSMHNIEATSSSSSSSSAPSRRAMCCSAYCCDPSYQNCGLATIVHTAALQFLQPKLIIMRTVNPSMLKLLKRTSPPGSKLYPNDCKTEEDWIEARSIARDAVKKWDHLSCEIEKYDEEKLVFKGAYSTELDEVFNKHSKTNSKDEVVQSPTFKDIHVNPGDAQLRIMVLS